MLQPLSDVREFDIVTRPDAKKHKVRLKSSLKTAIQQLEQVSEAANVVLGDAAIARTKRARPPMIFHIIIVPIHPRASHDNTRPAMQIADVNLIRRHVCAPVAANELTPPIARAAPKRRARLPSHGPARISRVLGCLPLIRSDRMKAYHAAFPLLRLHLKHFALGGGERNFVAVDLDDVVAGRQRRPRGDCVEAEDLRSILRRDPRRLPLQPGS